jgi:hypothetical protein
MQGLYQNKRQGCKVYTKIEGKEKFLALNWTTFENMVGGGML